MSAKNEEGRQQVPVIKVMRQSDANLTGNSQILVIDDDTAELKRLVDREPPKTEQDVMGTR